MPKNRFTFSQNFINKLVEITSGSIPPDEFEKLIDALQKESDKYFFNDSSEANLLRIFSAVYDKTLFISDMSRYPHHIEILTALSANSNYLTDIVVRNPEYLYQLFDQNYLTQKLNSDIVQLEIGKGLGQFKSFQAKLNYLRQIKKRYTLKIGLTDILGMEDLKSTTEQLSVLAKAINAKLFDLSFDEILLKYKINYPNSNFCLCSLGKLGGNELNYSSDVDLILFFDKNYHIKEIRKEYHEILSETALLFIKSSTQITDRGYIYRVDFRLRPDGKFSPLCKTLADYTKYYEIRGEDWERQMLIKLDFVCGSSKLYKQFTDFLQPYVYPATFSSSLKDQVKKMKSNIERQNKEKGDVKLFAGGIRDIEFSVQALQLLNGGKNKDLQTSNTLEAIQKLTAKDLLKVDEKKIYEEAYVFYRRIEHYLQLMNDTQTHLIPSDGELLNKLSSYLGFDNPDDFKIQLEQYRTSVRNIYNDILFTGQTADDLSTGINFGDKQKAHKNLTYLRNGLGISDQKEFDARTINLFNKIEPTLVEYLEQSLNPDRVLENFVKTIRTATFQSIWYNEFINDKFFNLFLRICEFSQKAVDLISSDKMLEEFFLTRRVFVKEPDDDFSILTTNQILFMLSVQYTLRLIDTSKISEILSRYVAIKINNALSRLGLEQIFFVGALGSCGSRAMNFNSDIDLIIVVDDVNKYNNLQEDFQKFIQIIQKELKPFEVDFRLRPEGKKSPVVTDINNYEKYLNERARTWELQTLLKLNFTAGDEKLFKQFKEMHLKRIKSINVSSVKSEINQMLNTVQKEINAGGQLNIKKQTGGLQTIDFILQAIILSNPKYSDNCIGKNIVEIIEYLREDNFEDLNELKKNYLKLRDIEFTIQNTLNANNAALPKNKEQITLLEKVLNAESQLDIILDGIIESNKNFLEKYLA